MVAKYFIHAVKRRPILSMHRLSLHTPDKSRNGVFQIPE